MVMSGAAPILGLVDENLSCANQGMYPMASWPTLAWLYKVLKSLGFFVYAPVLLPDHPDFRGEGNDRIVVVASRCQLTNPKLTEV